MVAEINDNLDVDDFKNMTPSEVVKKDYELCKERGDLAYFWQFAFAVQQELPFLIAENAEVFFRSITDEQFNAAETRYRSCLKAVRVLADYDDELASILKVFEANRSVSDDAAGYATKEGAKQHDIANLDKMIANRNALLK